MVGGAPFGLPVFMSTTMGLRIFDLSASLPCPIAQAADYHKIAGPPVLTASPE